MTDEKRDEARDETLDDAPSGNLTPVSPIAPRRSPWSTQMAYPLQPDQSEPDQPEPGQPEPEPSADRTPSPGQARIAQEAKQESPATEPPPGAAAVPTAPAAEDAEPPTTSPPQGGEVGAPSSVDFPQTMRETLRIVDQAWMAFRAAAERFPLERMDERLGEDAWTRKQMLEHVASWHDLTADRLVTLINTGDPAPLDRDVDAFNARAARQAVGKTVGEILKDMDATFNRLRRQMARLTDAQLQANDWWAAFVIAGNTYGHYEEHWADIYTPELPPNGRARR